MDWTYQADPSVGSLPRLLSARMRAPEKVFIRNSDGRDFSYAEFWALSGRIAQALADSGIEKGDRVAVQVEKSPEAIALLLACARAGAVFLPLNTAYTLAELDYFVGDAEPRLIIVAPERVPAIAETWPAPRRRRDVARRRGDGTFMEAANRKRRRFPDAKSAGTTSSPFSIPPARPAARRARC